jgi:peptidyl-prolyl cis-trans isomerase SurA
VRYPKLISILIFFTVSISGLNGQPFMVDKIVAVVGKNDILYSDIEDQYMQMMAQGVKPMPSKCSIFEDLLAQKLLVNQADIDSLVVDDAQVEMELNDRINYFINQIGTEQKLIEYFGKSVLEIKEDMRDAVHEQMLMQKMRMQITENMSVTPAEVRSFYNNLPKDSIPFINAQVEISQIMIYPKTSEEAVFDVREKLLALRERIMNGENFATMAVLYSEDGSASKGGDIGWATKAELDDPAYAKAAFALKKGQVSKIVESSFGYYIIQLLDRTDDRVHTRHILMKPKISIDAKQKALDRLDSILTLVRVDSFTFGQAAQRYSQDEETLNNGGTRVNPATGNTKFLLDQFETSEHYIIRDLKVGEISEPYESKDDKGNLVYKAVQLKSKTEPHLANMKQDFELLKAMALKEKEKKIIDDWVIDKMKNTYIRINEPYQDCSFRLKGWMKN